MEDDNLLFNCTHYNLSKSCFISFFGDNGVQLGEFIDLDKHEGFYECWRNEKKEKEGK